VIFQKSKLTSFKLKGKRICLTSPPTPLQRRGETRWELDVDNVSIG